MKKKILTPIFLFSLAGTALAYNLLQPLPVVGQSVESFPDYITKIIPFILGLAAVLAVVEIVIGGIEYAVTEAIDSKADAKDRIRQAILGLLLALASWLILYTINPELINLKLNIPGLPGGPVITLCQPACKIGEEICVDGTCRVLSGGDITKPPPVPVIEPPVPKIVDACPIGGSCEKAIELPPALLLGGKTVVINGQFAQETEEKIKTAIDNVYLKLPSDYQNLKNPGVVLNATTIDLIRSSGFGESQNQIEAFSGRSFSGETGGGANYITAINGDEIADKNPFYNSGTQFERTLIHELAHVLAADKFSNPNANIEWRELHDLSVRENKGFVTTDTMLSDDGTK